MIFSSSRRRPLSWRIVVISTLLMLWGLFVYFGPPDADANVEGGCQILSLGSSDDIILQGTLLTTDGPVSDGCIFIKFGSIVRIGHTPADCRLNKDATTIVCKDSVISPGFINTHEHIELSTVNPLHSTGELYKHRHDWRVGLRGSTAQHVAVNGTMEDAIKWGELRHIFSGTTSIVGGHMVQGLARNLDFVEGLGDGLGTTADKWAVFPLDDVEGIIRAGDCDYGPKAIDHQAAAKFHRYIAHVAEGVDEAARNEFQCLSSETFDKVPLPGGGGLSADIISPNFVLVHALGLSEADFDLVAARKAMVVWSPRSNIFLYGKTFDVTYLLRAGITVALGTDWLPSGSATMEREAACAFYATKSSFGQVLGTKTLWEMMTINAAKVAGFDHVLGSLEEGKLADIAVFSGKSLDDPYAAAVYGQGANLELVMRGGKILVAGSGLKKMANSHCEDVMFGAMRKIICVEEELGTSFSSFETARGGVYPAILPSIPRDEPSCEPSR
ncbi:metal dependent amidohydrolase [Dactylonectria estremocensis]|uniref:Metal dependent amidohydrolase n=1 Tax=Dactylonectria estremocensis TaxID=1079267 RepID=A0A9P9DQK6_9HYPO|nr:metal dependent amidohydrolase [Dactylonectria estremocensis]